MANIQHIKNLIDKELNDVVRKMHNTKSKFMKNYYLGKRAGLESAYALLCDETEIWEN